MVIDRFISRTRSINLNLWASDWVKLYKCEFSLLTILL